ncbi:deoxynucleoside kinase, partial [Myxococcota bacterium]
DEGVDLLAWHEKHGEMLAIQLKSRLTVAKKYVKRGISVAFPSEGWWYIVDHDWLLEQKPEIKKTKSWREGGEYNWPRLSAEWTQKLEPYRFGKAVGRSRRSTNREPSIRPETTKSCIQDRTLTEDPEIFAKYLHGLGHMSDDELQLYLEYFDRLNRGIRQPDKIIYLQCHEVDVLLSRIRTRGRKEEAAISQEFLEGLNGYYRAFPAVVKSKYGIEVMTFDVTHFNVHEPPQADAFLALAEGFFHEQ